MCSKSGDSNDQSYFITLTHGKSTDCRQANAHIRDKLESYNFGAYFAEKLCSRCPNDDCNTSFVFILPPREVSRLKHQVTFDVRPTVLHHKSFKELVHRNNKAANATKDVGAQIHPDMISKSIGTTTETDNVMCQTEHLVAITDESSQTENVVFVDTRKQPQSTDSIQPEFHENPILLIEQTSPAGNLTEKVVNSGSSPIRSLEFQNDDEDDEVVFVEIRPRTIPLPSIELKQEVIDPDTQVSEDLVQEIPVLSMQEVKVEPVDESNNAVPSIPEVLYSSNLSTPNSRSRKRSICSEQSSAKKMRFADVEICMTCLEVTDFASLEEYCGHVIDVHFSIFNCNLCQKTFFDTHHARLHAHSHQDVQEGQARPMRDTSAGAEISEGDFDKFMKTAIKCYPEKFHNVPPHRLFQIVKKIL